MRGEPTGGGKARASSVPTLPVAFDPYTRVRWERGSVQEALRQAVRRAQGVNLLLALVVLGLLGGLLYHSARTRIRPYVVEVDRHGQAVAFGPAEEMAEPHRRMLLHTLTLWVVRVRTVSVDREIQRREILSGYAYTGGRATELLNSWFRAHPPFARSQEEVVSVAVESLLSVGESERRFRLQWTETVRSPGGVLLREELWQALVTLEVDPPEHLEEVLTNPLGIRVVDFDWQRLATRSGSSLKNP